MDRKLELWLAIEDGLLGVADDASGGRDYFEIAEPSRIPFCLDESAPNYHGFFFSLHRGLDFSDEGVVDDELIRASVARFDPTFCGLVLGTNPAPANRFCGNQFEDHGDLVAELNEWVGERVRIGPYPDWEKRGLSADGRSYVTLVERPNLD